MKKLFATLFTLVIGTWLLALPVKADCVGQYGQYGQPCNTYSITVDKTVAIPSTSNYVDNLSISDPRYHANDMVNFRIVITNNSNTNLNDITAQDFIPQYLNPSSGPGSYDSGSRTISWDAGAFNVGEQKTYYFTFQVVPQANMPTDQGLFCNTNQVQIWSNNVTDSDSSQLCIEKQVSASVKTVPPTGPEFGYLLVTGEMVLAGLGIYLKKRV